MATTIALTSAAGTNAPYKLGSPPDFGTLYSGRALEFDGVTDSVDLSNVGLGTDDFTISVWVKTSQSSEGQIIRTAYTTPMVILGMYSSALRFEMNDGSNNHNTYYIATISDGMWHHIVASVDRDVSGKVYVDGSLVLTETDYADVDATLTQSGVSAIGKRPTTSTQYFDGQITNVQVWDKAWSLSDVQYAYTHPEKLITHNSSVTSGTTISNLKAWYPCTEGNPRSPQTTVYDGSPKELGSDNLGSWTNRVESPWTTWTASGTSVTEADSDGSATMIATNPFTAVAGKTYKASVNLTLNSGNLPDWSIRETASGTVGDGVSFTTTTAGVNNGYWTAPSSKTMYLFFHVSSVSSNFSLSDVSLKEVKMGNHGTTTFYGDELVSNGEFTSNYDGWIAVNASLSVDTNRLKVADDGAYSVAYQGVSTIVGKSYRIVFDASETSGNFHTSYGDTVPDGSTYGTNTLLGDDNTTGTYTYDFVATATTTYIGFGSNSSSYAIYDNISVKEIGVASGWTTADAEPLIPQTALMGMSKPMVFDGVDDYVVIDGAKDLLAVAADWSLSLWFNLEAIQTGDNKSIFSQQIGVNDRVQIAQNGADSLVCCTVDETTYYNGSETISANTWYHVVMVWDTDPSGVTAYLNGAVMSGSTGAAALGGAAGIDIGRQVGAQSTTYMQGCVNEIAMWSSKLTLAEVQAVFNDGVALDVSSDSGDYASSDDLVGYWRNTGTGTWTDLSDEGNDGTPAGSPDTILLPEGTTSGKDILGFPLTHTNNGWLNLDGSEYVDVISTFQTTFRGDFTLEFWCKPDDGQPSAYQIICGAENSTPEDAVFITLDTDGTIDFVYETDNDRAIAATSSAVFTDGAVDWAHFVFIANDANNTLKIYKNATRLAVSDGDASGETFGDFTTTSSFFIGARNANGTAINFFRGQVDELRIYNRVLTAYETDGSEPEEGEAAVSGEIYKNYNHGKSKHS